MVTDEARAGRKSSLGMVGLVCKVSANACSVGFIAKGFDTVDCENRAYADKSCNHCGLV